MAVQCKRKPFKSVAHVRTAIYAINQRKGTNAKLHQEWCRECKALHIVREKK